MHRHDWWPYVKGMIRRYPCLQQRYPEGVSSFSGSLHDLPATSQREFEAVRLAIATTQTYANGADRLAVIERVLWKKTHNLAGAAQTIPCAAVTAWRWHGDFIRLVARFYGLMDEIG